MIEINANKLHSRNCSIERITDGSVRLIKYIAPGKTTSDLLTLSKSYYGSPNDYTVRVSLPPQRKPDTVIIVSHTSANNWRVLSCTLNDVNVLAVNTLGEVNDILHSFLDK